MPAPGLTELATTTQRNRNMKTTKGGHLKEGNLTKNASQPGAKSSWKDTSQNKRTVPGKGSNHNASPGKLKEGNLTANASQPSGKGIGFTTGTQGSDVKAVPGIYKPLNGKGILTYPKISGKPDTFRGTHGSGPLRMSGVKGAHRIGCKK